MKTIHGALALASLCVASLVPASTAWAAVSVNFIHPENYADMPFDASDRARVIKELSDHFTHLGAKLPAGQDLRVDVLDIDLAGREIPHTRFGNDIRVMKGSADWPHMHLRYAIESHGTLLKSGDEQLNNMMYLERINGYSSGDPLRYEKQMIDDWYKAKIGTLQHG